MLERFGRQAFFSFRALNQWANWPAFIGSVIVAPGFTVAMIALTGRFARSEGAGQSYVAGMALVGANFAMIAGFLQTYTTERMLATLNLSLAARGSRLMMFLSRPVLHLPIGLLGIFTSLVASRLILATDFAGADWGVVALGYFLACCSSLAFGLVLGSFCLVLRDYANFVSLTQAMLLTLTGVVIPRSALPPGLDSIGVLLPVTNGLAAVRGGFDGDGLSTMSGHLVAEGAILLIYASLGFILYRLFERRAIATGEYEMS